MYISTIGSMSKITLLETLERIQKVRKVLIKHKSGLYQKDIARLTGIGKDRLASLIYNFFENKISVTKFGRNKLFKLIDKSPSEKEIRLILRKSALSKAKKLREEGFSYSEIMKILKKEFDMVIDNKFIRNIKMKRNGRERYQSKIRKDREKAGFKGGKAHVSSGHICRIQDARMEGYLKMIMARIPESSKFLTPPKVRIISHCLFDGFVTNDPFKGRYVVGYCNSLKGLLKQFISDMKKVYELKPTDIIKRENGYIVRYCCKAAVEDLGRYISFKGNEIIPKDIMNSPIDEFQIEFLRCFWDDEGMVGFYKRKDKQGYVHTHRFVEAFQKNINILEQIRKLQKRFGIESHIYGNKIKISDEENLKKFAKLINFSKDAKVCRTTSKWFGMRKRDLLKLAIDSYDS